MKLNINIKKLICMFASILYIIIFFTNVNAEKLKISSMSCILIEPKSGRVLYEKNSSTKMKIASLTKLMTGIIVMENAKTTDMVSISKCASTVGGSKVGLKTESQVSVESLLYGMFLESGNDCAIALAEHVGGNVENFVTMMNDKAKYMKLKNTVFSNPHGLDTENNSSSAKDIAEIFKYAINIKEIAKILGTKSITLNFSKTSKYLANTNRLLFTYEGCDGGKTGFTNIANRCLAVTAKRDDMRMICIILGASTTDIRFGEAKKLLDYGFNNYTMQDISKYMNWYVDIPIIKGNIASYKKQFNSEMIVPLKKGEIDEIYVKQDIMHLLVAPVIKKSYLGNVSMYIDDELIYKEKIYLDKDIRKKNILDYFISCYVHRFNIIQ